MQNWIALSDRDSDLQSGKGPALVERGLFVLEFNLPLEQPTVLLDYQDETGWPRTLSVFFDPDAGLMVLHRQGTKVLRHVLPGPVRQLQGVARLTFRFDAPLRHWQMRYEVLQEDIRHEARGTDVLPLWADDLRRLCSHMTGAQRHKSVLWFGVTVQPDLPSSAPWIGLRTPVETDRGPVPAGLLRPGDLIRTLDQGLLPLKALHRMNLPSRGSFAPVLLRQPYFGKRQDLLVSADQMVMISGASVEYLFGVEEALIPAGALRDGRVALREERRAVTASVALEMDEQALIVADGCCLLASARGSAPSPRRALRDYETLPLLALLGRTTLRHVA